MPMHRPSGNQKLGLYLALVVLLIWSFLPHVLKLLLRYMDPFSVTWYRFMFASLGFMAVLWHRGELPQLRRFSKATWVLLGCATLASSANYIGYLRGLELTSPATAQVLIQIGPVLLAVGGIAIFRERFTLAQWFGFGLLLAGLLIFFESQIAELANMSAAAERYRQGVVAILFAGIAWAAYSLAQKQLLVAIPSQPLMLCLFVGCAICYAPFVDLASILHLGRVGAVALVLSVVATAAAYGCFAAALEHIEAARVSVIIALVPLGTLSSSIILSRVAPELFPPESLPAASFLGAGVVVAGSLITSLGSRATAEEILDS
jgi:drug/metabolite transporter (DMT)-like permease